MSFITIILFLLKYGPALFSLVSELIDLIRKIKDPKEAAAFRADLQRAAQHYRVNKDRRPLEALRERLRNKCFNGDCPKP